MQEALWRAGKNEPHTPLTNLVLDPLLIFVCHFGMAVIGLIALLVVELLPDQVMLLFGAQNESIHYTLFARRCFRVYLIFHACRRCADGNSFGGRAGTDIPLTGNGEVRNIEKPGRILRNRGDSTRLYF